MKEATAVSINDYIDQKEVTQESFAKRLGVTQAAVSRWLSSPRKIKVVEHGNGVVDVVENKVIASSRKKR